MSVNAITLSQLTGEAQAIYVALNNVLNVRVLNWAAAVLALGTAGLQAAPYSMSSGDATDLFNAANDLDKFRKVFSGSMYVASGATVNSGVPTANDASHFGYPFSLNSGKVGNLGY